MTLTGVCRTPFSIFLGEYQPDATLDVGTGHGGVLGH